MAAMAPFAARECGRQPASAIYAMPDTQVLHWKTMRGIGT